MDNNWQKVTNADDWFYQSMGQDEAANTIKFLFFNLKSLYWCSFKDLKSLKIFKSQTLQNIAVLLTGLLSQGSISDYVYTLNTKIGTLYDINLTSPLLKIQNSDLIVSTLLNPLLSTTLQLTKESHNWKKSFTALHENYQTMESLYNLHANPLKMVHPSVPKLVETDKGIKGILAAFGNCQESLRKEALEVKAVKVKQEPLNLSGIRQGDIDIKEVPLSSNQVADADVKGGLPISGVVVDVKEGPTFSTPVADIKDSKLITTPVAVADIKIEERSLQLAENTHTLKRERSQTPEIVPEIKPEVVRLPSLIVPKASKKSKLF